MNMNVDDQMLAINNTMHHLCEQQEAEIRRLTREIIMLRAAAARTGAYDRAVADLYLEFGLPYNPLETAGVKLDRLILHIRMQAGAP